MKLLDIRFTFSCRTTHNNKEGQSSIVLRISFRGQRRDVFTGLYVFQNNWDSAEQRVTKREANYIGINQNLQLILRKACEAFDELKFSRNEFTFDDLIDKLRGRNGQPEMLIEFIEDQIQKI